MRHNDKTFRCITFQANYYSLTLHDMNNPILPDGVSSDNDKDNTLSGDWVDDTTSASPSAELSSPEGLCAADVATGSSSVGNVSSNDQPTVVVAGVSWYVSWYASVLSAAEANALSECFDSVGSESTNDCSAVSIAVGIDVNDTVTVSTATGFISISDGVGAISDGSGSSIDSSKSDFVAIPDDSTAAGCAATYDGSDEGGEWPLTNLKPVSTKLSTPEDDPDNVLSSSSAISPDAVFIVLDMTGR